MSPRWIQMLAWAWLIGTLMCLIIEGTYFGSTQTNVLNTLSVFRTVEVFGLWNIPVPNLEFFTVGIPRLLMWDYSFLEGGYAIFQWLFVVVFSVPVVFALTMAFIGVIDRLFTR